MLRLRRGTRPIGQRRVGSGAHPGRGFRVVLEAVLPLAAPAHIGATGPLAGAHSAYRSVPLRATASFARNDLLPTDEEVLRSHVISALRVCWMMDNRSCATSDLHALARDLQPSASAGRHATEDRPVQRGRPSGLHAASAPHHKAQCPGGPSGSAAPAAGWRAGPGGGGVRPRRQPAIILAGARALGGRCSAQPPPGAIGGHTTFTVHTSSPYITTNAHVTSFAVPTTSHFNV